MAYASPGPSGQTAASGDGASDPTAYAVPDWVPEQARPVVSQHPEALPGAAFAGGLILGLLLKRLGS
jgi:hypothetical protein